MTGWTQINGTAVALPQENVDTDQLIPARFMSAPRADGYGKFLLHDLRQDAVDHVLDRHAGADVLITRRNFGSGSRRRSMRWLISGSGPSLPRALATSFKAMPSTMACCPPV